MTAREPQAPPKSTWPADPEWQQAPARLDAPGNVVDIWRIGLPQAHSREASHAARSAILKRYLAPGQRLTIDREPGGKPYAAPLGSGPEFNLSHTRGLALLAVSSRYAVGIDVEKVRAIRDPLRIAKRVLPGQVAERLQQMDPDNRPQAFFCHWTRFEAIQKSAGRGVFEPPVDPELVQVHEFDPFDGFVCCLAVATLEALTFRYFDYLEP